MQRTANYEVEKFAWKIEKNLRLIINYQLIANLIITVTIMIVM